MKKHVLITLLTLFLGTTFLTSCGGGGGDSAPTLAQQLTGTWSLTSATPDGLTTFTATFTSSTETSGSVSFSINGTSGTGTYTVSGTTVTTTVTINEQMIVLTATVVNGNVLTFSIVVPPSSGKPDGTFAVTMGK
jgi:hypothetical protein